MCVDSLKHVIAGYPHFHNFFLINVPFQRKKEIEASSYCLLAGCSNTHL